MTDSDQRPDTRRRREFLGGALVGMAAGSLGALSAAPTEASAETNPKAKRTVLAPGGLLPDDSGYSQGILADAGRMVCVSGQGPNDLNAEMETQLRQTMENIGRVLKEAGASFDNVVFLRGYFVHIARDLPIYRKVRKDYLVKPYPASSCVGVTELAIEGLEIEIEAIAII
jgi:2-iminobutanoate/2-iminopropanoate deaminase